MPKNPKVSFYEISTQVRVLDKTIVPQIVVDREPVLLIAHVGVLRAGESRRGAKRWFAFQKKLICTFWSGFSRAAYRR